MIDYALFIYKEERVKVTPTPISARFCPDVAVANKTLDTLKKAKINFGVAGNLFRCISEGKLGKSSYKLESYVNIPLKEPTEKEILNYRRQLKRWKKGCKKGAKPVLPPPKILDPRVVEVNII